jgi:hypothetical protein
VDISWHDTLFWADLKVSLRGNQEELHPQGSKIWRHQRQKWTVLLAKSCTEINVFNKQPISLASFLVTCMLFYLVTWAAAPSAPTNISVKLQLAVQSLKEDRLTVESHEWKAVVWFLLTVHMSVREHLMWRGIYKCTKVVVHKAKGLSHHSTTPVSAHLNLCNFKIWIMLSAHVELVPYPKCSVMGQRDVLVLSLGQSNFFLDTSLSLLVLCTLLMVSFMWLRYNHFRATPSMHNCMLLDSPLHIHSWNAICLYVWWWWILMMIQTCLLFVLCVSVFTITGPCSFPSSIIISNFTTSLKMIRGTF